MTQREADYEAVIVQKLRDMEGLLKSFMASLGGPSQRKGGLLLPVYPPFDGTLLSWNRRGGIVGEDDLLCIVEAERYPGYTKEVFPPAGGLLTIRAEEGDKVYEIVPIATIDTSYA